MSDPSKSHLTCAAMYQNLMISHIDLNAANKHNVTVAEVDHSPFIDGIKLIHR